MSRDDDVSWTLLVQMDPVIHLSVGHRSLTPLDLSGLTREKRVMVQASINNERDFDRVAEALIIQLPRTHLRESQRRVKGKGKDWSKRGDNSNTRWFRGKGKGKHTSSGKSGASVYYANFTSVEDYEYDDDMNEPAEAYQAHNDPFDPGSDDGEEALVDDDGEEMTRFLHMLLWMMSLFWRQLNWMQLLFWPTRGTMILTLK